MNDRFLADARVEGPVRALHLMEVTDIDGDDLSKTGCVVGATGFVHDVATAHFDGDFRGHKAYMCGPPAMIDACITALMRGRLFERDMYMERFYSAADASQNIRKSPLFKSI